MTAPSTLPGEFRETGYDPAAPIYDLEYPECEGDELVFWSELAYKAGTVLLELAAGTGRVTLALAGLGYDVTGLDNSPEMLLRAEAKREALRPRMRQRATHVDADMRHFALGRTFDMVFVAFNSFLLLPDAQARAQCLACARTHLRPNGIFAVDVFAATDLDRKPDHEEVEFLELDPASGRRITRERFYDYDPAGERGTSTLIYRLYDANGAFEERRFGYSLALVGRDQFVREIESAGFAVTDVYGDYMRSTWTQDSPNLIVVASAPGR